MPLTTIFNISTPKISDFIENVPSIAHIAIAQKSNAPLVFLIIIIIRKLQMQSVIGGKCEATIGFEEMYFIKNFIKHIVGFLIWPIL